MSFDGAQFLRNTIRLDRYDTMTPTVMDAQDTARAAETGKLAGATVTVVSDPAADLQDAMEELSMQFEEKAAKKLGERKLGKTRQAPNAFTQAVEEWMKTLPDMPGKDQLDRLLRMLRNAKAAGNLPDAGGLKKMLGELSGDASHQFAMLDVLEQSLGEGDDAIRNLFSAARDALVSEKGGEIRAGINLAAEVNARATTPEEMSDLRGLYRSEILGFRSPQDCFRSILSSRGAGALEKAIEFLTAGCGTDLTSAAPSRDPAELRRIMTDLQCVQVLHTVLDTMNGLAGRMLREFGEQVLKNGESMTGTLLDFTEKPYVQSTELAAFVAECGVRKLLARMDFARELMGIFRKLSPRLFAAEDDRLRLVEASEEFLDGIIAEENASEEDSEEEVLK